MQSGNLESIHQVLLKKKLILLVIFLFIKAQSPEDCCHILSEFIQGGALTYLICKFKYCQEMV